MKMLVLEVPCTAAHGMFVGIHRRRSSSELLPRVCVVPTEKENQVIKFSTQALSLFQACF